MSQLPDIREFVARLERAWVEPLDGDLARFTAVLEERQRILAEIQKADASSLDPETRRELAERIQAVRERDARLIAALQTRQAEALKELDQALNARGAARGYRAAEGPTPTGFRKIA